MIFSILTKCLRGP